MNWTLRAARRLVVAVIGLTVVLMGVVMLVTPGPAMLVIPAGLMILATEFAWARHLLKRVRREVALRTGLGSVEEDDEDDDAGPDPRPPAPLPGIPEAAGTPPVERPPARPPLDSKP